MGGYHSALHKLWCVIAEIRAVEKETRKEYGVGNTNGVAMRNITSSSRFCDRLSQALSTRSRLLHKQWIERANFISCTMLAHAPNGKTNP